MKTKLWQSINKFVVFAVFPLATALIASLSIYKNVFAQNNAGGPPAGADAGGPPASSGSLTDTGTSGQNGFELQNPLSGVNDIGSFIKKILDIVLTIGIPVVALFIIYSGFLFVTARGNSEKLGDAKKTFGYTLLGAAILLGSWVLAQALGDTVKQLQ